MIIEKLSYTLLDLSAYIQNEFQGQEDTERREDLLSFVDTLEELAGVNMECWSEEDPAEDGYYMYYDLCREKFIQVKVCTNTVTGAKYTLFGADELRLLGKKGKGLWCKQELPERPNKKNKSSVR